MVMAIQDSWSEHPLYRIGAYLQEMVVKNPLTKTPSEIRIWRDEEGWFLQIPGYAAERIPFPGAEPDAEGRVVFVRN